MAKAYDFWNDDEGGFQGRGGFRGGGGGLGADASLSFLVYDCQYDDLPYSFSKGAFGANIY